MNVTNRLTTTASVVSAVVCRKFQLRTIHQEFKIIRTIRDATRNSFDRTHRDSRRESGFASLAGAVSRPDSMLRDPNPSERSTMNESIGGNCESQNLQSALGIYEIPVIDETSGMIRSCDESMRDLVNFANVDAIMGAKRGKNRQSMTKTEYRNIRKWRPNSTAQPPVNPDVNFVLRIISYNILAQILLDNHFYLYREHDDAALIWDKRKVLVQQEIFKAKANVICLQEMQLDHVEDFVAPFEAAGYRYLYKKRTNDKQDGLLLLYRADQLKLVDHAKLELYQSGVDILNRDNVAIIAKFSLVDDPETHVVISTTHLLYNPRRHDIRLAQTQLLFAELERIAFIETTKDGPRYHPIILSGDFNLEPHTAVYRFITEGSFEYNGKGRSLETETMTRIIGNSLIPPCLLVTDNCQHMNLLTKRLRGEGDGTTMLDNIDDKKQRSSSRCDQSKAVNSENKDKVVTNTDECQNVKIVEGQYAKFSSGTLTHPFELRSVYKHVNKHGEAEATTNQEKWITVDYIFFGGVEPIERYDLPTVTQCKLLPTIPNNVVGSDHLCIGATFQIKKLKKKTKR